MGVISAAKEVLGRFLEGSGKKLRLQVESHVTNARSNSPNETKKVNFKKKQPNKQKLSNTGDIDQSNHNSGIQAENVHVDTLQLVIQQPTTPPATSTPLTMDDLPEELRRLTDAFNRKEVSFVTEREQQTVNAVVEFEKNPNIASQMRYFKERLSMRDYYLMRTGFFLRYLQATNPEQVRIEWQKIQTNTDKDERRIINLASAGYFESYFRPLAKTYDDENRSKQEFREQFERIIDDSRFVVFVNAKSAPGAVISEVEAKARKNVKFRVQDEIIYIHATGASSISTAAKAVEILRESFKVQKAQHSKNSNDKSVRYKVYYRETIEPSFYEQK